MNELKTVKDLVYRADELYGDGVFVREYRNKSFCDTSFSEFRKMCDSVAVWIKENFTGNVHIALAGSTSLGYLVSALGIQVSGNVAVPIDTANSAERIADEVNRSDSEALFLDGSHIGDAEKISRLCPNVKYFVSISGNYDNMLSLDQILNQYSGLVPETDVKESDLSAIFFTSGTTGQSKGVMLSHGNLIDNTTCHKDPNYVGKKMLSVLPVHHVYCFTCDILCSLWNGVTVCVNDSLMRIPRNLKLFQPEFTTFVPMIASTILSKMEMAVQKTGISEEEAKKQIFGDNFEIIFSGGAYLSPEVTKGYKKFGIEISQGYGMTECSPRICTGEKNCKNAESVGKIVDRCEVKIVDGEIWVKSKSVMQGYYKNPEETAKSLTPDGWLMTGDLGHMDSEGYLYITGRKKNLIILSNGENVSPEEIENKFAVFAPVKEIVVYADGETITAQVYPDPEYTSSDIQAEINQKIEEVNNSFPSAKRIQKVIFRDTEFPKTASRKIIRAEVI